MSNGLFSSAGISPRIDASEPEGTAGGAAGGSPPKDEGK